MSSSPRQQLVCVGRILGTFGVHGYVKCAYTTDHPERLASRQQYLLVDSRSRECIIVDVADVQLRKDNFTMRFAGFAAPEPLKRYSGWELHFVAKRGELPREDDEVYYFELDGMEVRRPDGSAIGHVSAITETAAHVLLSIDTLPSRLIPFTKQYVPELSVDEGWLITTYPLDDV